MAWGTKYLTSCIQCIAGSSLLQRGFLDRKKPVKTSQNMPKAYHAHQTAVPIMQTVQERTSSVQQPRSGAGEYVKTTPEEEGRSRLREDEGGKKVSKFKQQRMKGLEG